MSKVKKVIFITFTLLVIFTGTVFAAQDDGVFITVIEGVSGTTYTTNAKTVSEFFKSESMPLNKYDKINVSPDAELKDSMTISIIRAVPVTLIVDDVPKMLMTAKPTVKELLNEYDAETEFGYENVAPNDRIVADMEIIVQSKIFKEFTENEKIPFQTIKRENDDLYKDVKSVVQEGVNGQKNVTYADVFYNKEKIDTIVIAEHVTMEPVDEIIEIGTREKPNNYVETKDGSFLFSKKLTMEATAYTQYDAGCNNVTATGTTLRKGVVAVDPNVIPLGTKLYVEGYGFASAEDVGGAIQGSKIDLAHETLDSAFRFGRRDVVVYVITDEAQ